MKAIIEIELEVHGHYKKQDRETLIEKILLSLDGAWLGDDDMDADYLMKSASGKIVGKP